MHTPIIRQTLAKQHRGTWGATFCFLRTQFALLVWLFLAASLAAKPRVQINAQCKVPMFLFNCLHSSSKQLHATIPIRPDCRIGCNQMFAAMQRFNLDLALWHYVVEGARIMLCRQASILHCLFVLNITNFSTVVLLCCRKALLLLLLLLLRKQRDGDQTGDKETGLLR